MNPADDRGAPSGIADPKRPADKVPVNVDWHDYLINERKPGVAIAPNFTVRPRRQSATGLEYKATTSGVTSFAPNDRIRWPTTAAQTVTDGTVIWTSQAVSTSSLRATISSNAWTFDNGVTKSDESNSDLVYTAFAAAGFDGQTYALRQSVTLSNGEVKEALILLPVKD
jgi:hypothetical protein